MNVATAPAASAHPARDFWLSFLAGIVAFVAFGFVMGSIGPFGSRAVVLGTTTGVGLLVAYLAYSARGPHAAAGAALGWFTAFLTILLFAMWVLSTLGADTWVF